MALLFEFVQFEFTHSVGPPAGRYIVESDGAPGELEPPAGRPPVTGVTRGVGVADVLVISVVSAPASRARLRRKARDADSAAAPAEVPLLHVTFVRGTAPLADQREAERRLEDVRASEEEQWRWVDEGMRVLNGAIRAYRAGAHDPYAIEVTPRDARKVRIGYGSTEDVQAGRWQAAVELAPPLRARSKRTERLRPSEAVAAVLSGRGRVLEGEDVILRALVDLDQGRTRAAALEVHAGLTLLVDELGLDATARGGRPALAALAETAQELATVATRSALDDAQIAELETIIDATDGLVDAWRYEGSEKDR